LLIHTWLYPKDSYNHAVGEHVAAGSIDWYFSRCPKCYIYCLRRERSTGFVQCTAHLVNNHHRFDFESRAGHPCDRLYLSTARFTKQFKLAERRSGKLPAGTPRRRRTPAGNSLHASTSTLHFWVRLLD